MNKKITYKPLWKTLIDKSLQKNDLRFGLGLAPSIIANMSKNRPVTLNTILKIAEFLDCNIEDIVEIIDK